ncbi:unnamed protein product [Spirodela intermedia]|uniref:Copper transport protein n=1 Tax=Spirodela intermedia TaxID=51605 RepID=A0A7I8K0Q3_SPIIN|nr:unnamed protein product [Spirodela intermedia]
MAGEGHHHGGTMEGGMMGEVAPPAPSTAGGAHRMGMGGMHMTFFWGKDVQILFSGWPGSREGVGTYLLALCLVFALAAAVEFLSYAARRFASVGHRGGGAARLSGGLARTAVHAIRVGLAYVVMLAVMSFNVGVLAAAVAGHALGFLLSASGAFGRGAAFSEDKL